MATGNSRAMRKPRKLPLLADETQQLEVIKRWAQEDDDQLARLADDLGIADDPGRWHRLALALARKYEPAFMERALQVKWTPVTRGMLVVEIERLTGDRRLTSKFPDNPSHTATWAAGILSKRPEWKDFLHGGEDPAEALRVQYSKFHRDKWAQVCRDAFKLHQLHKTVAKWEMELRDALERA